MDFDRTAIASLADLQREWSGLDAERAKVEDRLRNLDNNERNSVWRGGGGPGRGGAGGRGNGLSGGRGTASGSVGGQLAQSPNTWSREKSRDGSQHQISREKIRAMNRVWERGLDPETAAADEEVTSDANSTYRPPQRGERGANAPGTGTGDRVPAGREVFVRSDTRGTGEDRNRSRNSPMIGGGIRGRGRRESDPGAAGTVEPEAKRPRVTSAIVVPPAEGNGGHDGAKFRDDGELDRWNGGQAMDEDGGDGAEEEVGAVAEDKEAAGGDHPENGEDRDQQQGQQQQRYGGKIVVVSSTVRGRRAERETAQSLRSERGGMGRFRSGMSRVGSGRPEIRSSLASRLGPIVGRPVVVVGDDEAGEEDNEGELAPPEPKPMVEPSKPELQAAYKDGDTKKRNRRMFGGLIAHLGRARERLEEDKGLIEKQQSMAEQAVNRQKEEKRRQRQMAIEAARKERDDELHKRDEIYARQEKAFIALHSNAFIVNQEQLKGSIFTKVLPRLAWRPNEHTDATQALLVASDLEIDERIKQRREADDKAFLDIDEKVAQKAAHREKRRGGFRNREEALERGGGVGNKDANSNGNGNGVGQHGEKSWDTQEHAGNKVADTDGDDEQGGKKRSRESEAEEEKIGDGQGEVPDPGMDADPTENRNEHEDGAGDSVDGAVVEEAGGVGNRALVDADAPTDAGEGTNSDGRREEQKGEGEGKGDGEGGVGDELQAMPSSSVAEEDEAGGVGDMMKGAEEVKAGDVAGAEQPALGESAPSGAADEGKAHKRRGSKKRKADADDDDADADADADADVNANADADVDADPESEKAEGPSRSAAEGPREGEGREDSDDGDEGVDESKGKERVKKKSRKSSRKHGKEGRSRKSSSRRSRE